MSNLSSALQQLRQEQK